jgi:hypothetical protein
MRREASPIVIAGLSALAVACGPDRDPGAAPRVHVEAVDPAESAREMARESQEMCDVRFLELSSGLRQAQENFRAGDISIYTFNDNERWFCEDMRVACEGASTVPAGAIDCFPPTVIEVRPPSEPERK